MHDHLQLPYYLYKPYQKIDGNEKMDEQDKVEAVKTTIS